MPSDTYDWTGSGDGSTWNDPKNWNDITTNNPSGFPEPNDYAYFYTTASLNGTTGNAQSIILYANSNISNSTLNAQQYILFYANGNILNSTLNAQWLDIAANVSVSGGSIKLQNSGYNALTIAYDGNSTLTLTGGATVTADSGDPVIAAVTVGATAGETGTLNINDGSSLTTTTGDDIAIDGTAFVNITNNAKFIAISTGNYFTLTLGRDVSGQAIVSVTSGAQLIANTGGGLGIGGAGSELTVSAGGTLTVDATDIGYGPVASWSGSLTITGAGSTGSDTGVMVVGANGDGSVTVSQGGALSIGSDNNLADTDSVYLGIDAGGSGTMNVTDSHTNVTVNGQVDDGLAGTGYLMLQSGASMTTGDATGGTAEGIDIGNDAGGSGTFIVQGSGTKLTNVGQIVVGEYGTGTFTIADGAQVTTSINANLQTSGFDVASGQGSTGTVTITGAGTSLSATDIDLDSLGAATVTISDGAQVTDSGDFTLDPQNGGNVDVTLTGANTLLSVGGAVYVGGSGTGTATLNIQDGATLDAPPDLIIAQNAAPTAQNPPTDPDTGFRLDAIQVINVNGATGATLHANQIIVGQAGNGALIVAGGTIIADDTLTIGDKAGSQGQFLLDGTNSSLESQDVTVGSAGKGLLSIGNGNEATTDGDATVGAEADGSGFVTVGDASGSSTGGADWSISGSLTVGGGGAGTVTVTPASSLSVGGNLVVGDQAGSKGHLTFTGGSLSMPGGTITVGNQGSGSLLFQTGATLSGGTTLHVPSVVLGAVLGSSGSMTVTGLGTSIEIDDLTVGEAGTGSLSVTSDATLVVDGMADVGADAIGATQKLTLDSGGTMSVTGDLTLGTAAIASVSIKGGAQLAGDSNVVLGDEAGGAAGLVTVSGTSAGATNHIPSGLGYGLTLTIGDHGIGKLTISGGGLVAPTPGGTGEIDVAAEQGSQGTVTLSGSGSALKGKTLYLGGTTSAAGGLGKLSIGSGASVTISGAAYLWNRASATVSGGHFAVGLLTIAKGASVSGNGTLSGSITDNGILTASGGLLDVVGSLSGSGSVNINSGATLELANSADGVTIHFKGTGDTLQLDDSANVTSTISGFTAGDTIELAGLTATSAEDTSGTLDVYDGTSLVASFALSGNYEGANFDVSKNSTGTAITLDPSQPPGLPVVTSSPLAVSVPATIAGEAGTAVPVAGLAVNDSATGATITVELLTATGLLAATTGATGGGGTITTAADGTGLVITGSLDQVNADLSTVTYTSSATGADAIQAIATDSAGNSDEDTTNITASGQSLTLALPGAETLTALVSSPITGIGITDTLSAGAELTVTISDTTGALAADENGASTVTGTGTATLVITGDLADVNADLASLSYTGASTGVAATETDTIVVSVDDGAGGTANGTIAVTVDRASDQTPFIEAPASETVPSSAPASIAGVSLVVADSTGKTFTVTLSDTSGTLSVGQDGASVVTGAGSTKLTITGDLADVNADLASLTYAGALSALGSDTISIAVADSFGLTESTSIAVTAQTVVFPAGTDTVNGAHSVGQIDVAGTVTFAGAVTVTGIPGDDRAVVVDGGGDAIFGAGASLTTTGSVVVGESGSGTLVLSDGATAHLSGATSTGPADALDIGTGGSVTLEGLGTSLTTDGGITINGGSATLSIMDGAIVTALSDEAGGAGAAISISGALVLVQGSEAALNATSSDITVGAAGVFEVQAGGDASVASLSVSGSAVPDEDGSVSVDGTLDVANAITVDGGALQIDGTVNAASIDITDGGTLSYYGGNVGAPIVVDGGMFDDDLLGNASNTVSGVTLTGGTDNVNRYGTAKINVTFATGADATLVTETSYLAQISAFALGDTIDLTDVSYNSSDTATLNSGNLLSITKKTGGDYKIQLDPSQNFAGLNFVLNDDGADRVDLRLTGQLALTYTWAQPTDGSFDDAGAWTPTGGPPGPEQTAVFGAGTYTVNGSGTAGQIDVDGNITFTGAIAALGNTSGSDALVVDQQGSLTLDGGASVTVGDGANAVQVVIGDAGSGALTLAAGAKFIFYGPFVIGNLAGSTGIVTINGGIIDVGTYLSSDNLIVGDQGSAGLYVEANSSVAIAGDIDIAANTTGSGTLNVVDSTLSGYGLAVGGTADQSGGQGAILVSNGSIDVSDVTIWGSGTITMHGGFLSAGTISVQAGGLISGSGTISAGTITDNGTISIDPNTALVINGANIAGTGSIAIGAGGTLVLGPNISLASIGAMTFASGSTLDLYHETLTTAQLLALDTGAASLILDQGTTLTNTGATLNVGAGTTLGTVTLDGTIVGGTIVDAGSGLIGKYGTLSGVTVQGTLDLSAASNDLGVTGGITLEGANGTGPGTVNLTGAGSGLDLYSSVTLNNATINIGNNSSVYSGENGAPAVLTLGSSLSVVQAAGGATLQDAGNTGDGIVNDGSIAAAVSGGYFYINGNSFTNNGRISVANGDQFNIDSRNFINTGTIVIGAGGTLVVGDNTSLTNSGTVIFASGSAFGFYYETLTTAQLLTDAQVLGFDESNASLILGQGTTLTNTGATLNVGVGTTFGTVALQGTIVGGTIADAGGGLIGNSATLSGVTYQGTLDLNASNANLTIIDGITLAGAGDTGAGTVNLTGSYSHLNIDGTTTLNDATINIGNNGAVYSTENGAAAVLTLGSSLSIVQAADGASLQDGGNAGDGIVNDGSITAAVSGGYFYILGASFINNGSISISNGDALEIGSSNFTNTGIIGVSGGRLDIASGTTFTNTGTIDAAGGTLTLNSTLGGTGRLQIEAGATLELASGAEAGSNTIAFDGRGATLEIGDSDMPTGTIAGFAATDTIDLANVSYASGVQANLLARNVLEITETGAGTFDLQLDPAQNFSGTTFSLVADEFGGTDITTAIPPVVTLAPSPTAVNSQPAILGTAAPGLGTDGLSVALIADADFATGSTLVLNDGTLLYTPGVITTANAGPDIISYSVTDTVTGAVTTEMQTVTLGTFSGVAEDGYIIGGTVGYDNGSGSIDYSQPTTTTNARGSFTLTGGSGPFVLTGGTDSATGLAFTGTLEAPAGSTVLSPLTTLVEAVVEENGDSSVAGIAAANASVVEALGLPTGTDLTTLDAEAGTLAGSTAATQALEAGSALQDVISLIAAAGGNTGAALTTLAATVKSGGALDLTGQATITAAAITAGLDTTAAASIANIVSTTAAALDAQLQNATTPMEIFNDVTGASIAQQGDAVAAISAATAAGDDSAYTAASTDYTTNLTATLAVDDATAVSNDPVCFCPGTLIRTPEGEVPVETLARGDLVLTSEGLAKCVTWIGRQTVSTRFADPLRVLPIRIRAGALDENVPSRDLLLSPDHAVLVGDILFQAGVLVNGHSIIREANVPVTFTYYHVELDDHSLILAESTPAETFIDNVERLAFDNWEEHEAFYPDGKPISEMAYPRAKAYRQVPMRLRGQLAARGALLYGNAVNRAA